MKSNMEKAEELNVFGLVWQTYNYKVISQDNGMALGVKCPNDEEFYFDTDLNIERFYESHLPQIKKEIKLLSELYCEASKID